MRDKKNPKKRAESPPAESAPQDMTIDERLERIFAGVRKTPSPEEHALATMMTEIVSKTPEQREAMRRLEDFLSESVSKTPEQAEAMPIFEESLTRLKAQVNTPIGAGWNRLWQLLSHARNDTTIQKSEPASELLDLMWGIVGDSLFCASVDEALQPTMDVYNSQRNSKASKISHKGRESTKRYAESLFLDHTGKWTALNTAAMELAPKVIAKSRQHSRPLSPANAIKTISGWFSEFVRRDANAFEKLTSDAQRTIERAQKRSR